MNKTIMSYPPSTSCGEIGMILHIILNNVFPYKTDGTFVEVGANDGKTGSFTYNLASMGWYGLNFEPVPRLYELCCMNHKNHTNVKNFPIGIGEKSCSKVIIDADTLSSIDGDTIETYREIPQFSSYFKENKSHTIQIETLNKILEENDVTKIDMLVLDVEGYEENVLKGFSIDVYKPSVIIIEICDQHPDFVNNSILMEKFKRLRTYFHEYTLLVNDVVDNVYIHNDIYNKLDPTWIDNVRKYVRFPQYVR